MNENPIEFFGIDKKPKMEGTLENPATKRVPKVQRLEKVRISQAKGQSNPIDMMFSAPRIFLRSCQIFDSFFIFHFYFSFSGGFMETFHNIVKAVNGYMGDYILLVLLIGTGLFYTIRTRFVQVRCFGEGMKRVFGDFSMKGGKHRSGMSSFQALATAVAAQVGTGNIVGASGAILVGGPGAIFWMWIIAFLGMATIYGEAVLAQETRVIDKNGSVQGGPVYYIKRAFKGKFGSFLAVFFAVAIILSLGFMGAMVQSNSIGSTFKTALGIPSWVIGIILAALSAFIFLGGVQRIASVTEKLVPVMACLYLVGGLIVLACRVTDVPAAFGMIFKYAFAPQALAGGAFGATIAKAISQGAKRGLFSNEAGMGSTPHAHAQANVKNPHEQGVVAMIGVFIDTFVVLTMTALVVITCLYTEGGILAGGPASGVDKTNMAQLAFGSVFGSNVGNLFVAVCLLFFAFSTIIGWNLFGKINVSYLFGRKGEIVYGVIAVVCVFLGTVLDNNLVWDVQDTLNQLMVIPNAIALIALSGMVVNCCNQFARKKADKSVAPEQK